MTYQQGDVILEKVEEVKGKKLNHLILAKGEATGHSHCITEGKAELFEDDDGYYLRVLDDIAKLTHQEHKPVAIPKGNYLVRKVREYDHFLEEAREVRD